MGWKVLCRVGRAASPGVYIPQRTQNAIRRDQFHVQRLAGKELPVPARDEDLRGGSGVRQRRADFALSPVALRNSQRGWTQAPMSRSATTQATRCPICSSPARWLALLEQGGDLGKHIKRTITQTIARLFARGSALSDGCSGEGALRLGRLRHASRRFHTHSQLERAYRAAARKLGLCTTCRKRKAKPGYSQCGECQKERARRKRMARRIGGKRCACGQPAVNIRAGEYVCSTCLLIETRSRRNALTSDKRQVYNSAVA